MASVPNEAAETAIRRIPVSCFMPFSFRGDWGYYNITAFSKNRRQRRWAAGAIAQTKQRLSGNFRGRYPDVGVRAGVRPLAPLNPDLFTASTEEPIIRMDLFMGEDSIIPLHVWTYKWRL